MYDTCISANNISRTIWLSIPVEFYDKKLEVIKLISLLLFPLQKGRIPLRHLVYRVHALPESMRSLVWDFGQLNPEVEELYTRQIVRRYVSSLLIVICKKNINAYMTRLTRLRGMIIVVLT